jgi:hypothetical protein
MGWGDGVLTIRRTRKTRLHAQGECDELARGLDLVALGVSAGLVAKVHQAAASLRSSRASISAMRRPIQAMTGTAIELPSAL